MSDSTTPWYIAIGSTIITALSSALTYLFKLRENENSKRIDELKTESAALKQEVKEISSKADQCEADRATLFAECSVLKNEIKNMQTRMTCIDLNGTEYSHRNLPKSDK